MSKIKIEVCEVCRQEDCNGKVYRVPESYILAENTFYKLARWCPNTNGITKVINAGSSTVRIYLRMVCDNEFGIELEEIKNGDKV